MLPALLVTVVMGNQPQPARASVTEVDSRMQLGSSEVPVRQWFDNNVRTKAVVVAVHGAARHSGTFQTLGEDLAKQGYLVLSPDLRGHGQWFFEAAKKSEKVADYDASTNDLVNLIEHAHKDHPQLPIFCIGESAGAAVAIRAGSRAPSLSGLIISSIGTKPCLHDFNEIVRDVCTGLVDFDKPLDVKESLEKYSSDEPRIREQAAADPLIKPGLSARELLRTCSLLNHTPAFAAKLPAHIPVLMLQGKEDQIVQPASAKDVLKHIKSDEKSLVEFPSGHILLSTPFLRDDVYSTVSDWLAQRTAEQHTALLHQTKSLNE
jgi:alpha-beta hydrolase superfamily lysophospholipase